VVEYAWRQPDGEIAPVLQTEGYTLMIKSARGEWVPEGTAFVSDLVAAGWTRPGEATCTHEHVDEGAHTNGYVIAHDAFQLAVTAFGEGYPSRGSIRDLAHWFHDEMIALGQFREPDQAESPFQVGALLSSNDPELPVGSVVVDCHGELWYRPTLEADEDPRRCWVSRDDAQSWTKVAGNYGPVRVIALPQA
jgi:hypothetical protein